MLSKPIYIAINITPNKDIVQNKHIIIISICLIIRKLLESNMLRYSLISNLLLNPYINPVINKTAATTTIKINAFFFDIIFSPSKSYLFLLFLEQISYN